MSMNTILLSVLTNRKKVLVAKVDKKKKEVIGMK